HHLDRRLQVRWYAQGPGKIVSGSERKQPNPQVGRIFADSIDHAVESAVAPGRDDQLRAFTTGRARQPRRRACLGGEADLRVEETGDSLREIVELTDRSRGRIKNYTSPGHCLF